MILRAYRRQDCRAILRLFYESVHTVAARDYTRAQLDAWATGKEDASAWHASLSEHMTLVAEENGILGFGDIDETGYFDRLYVRGDAQGRGVATALCDALEAPYARIVAHVSLTARRFFEGRGYHVLREQQVERHGILLTNFVMERLKR